MPRVRTTWPLRARQAALIVVLLAWCSSLESSPALQADDLTVRFSPAAGTFVGEEAVTLRVDARADIHYTVDGSLPTATSPVYEGPLSLDRSTRLRAVAIARGAGPAARADRAVADSRLQGPVATEIYLRVDAGARSFTSHLPIIL